jgi:hypothetical protein
VTFNEEAVKAPFPATLRHIAAVPGQRSDTDGPNLENTGALKPQHFGPSIAAQSEKSCLVLPAAARSRLGSRQVSSSDNLRSPKRCIRGNFVGSTAQNICGAAREAVNDHLH